MLRMFRQVRAERIRGSWSDPADEEAAGLNQEEGGGSGLEEGGGSGPEDNQAEDI